MKKALVLASAALIFIGAILPFAPVGFLKAPIQRALARGLGRRVEIDGVHLTLFSGPGFSLDGVTIHEDPRAGIEPFAYAGTLDARLDLLGLLRGRLEFASLRLSDATFNLVKPVEGPWNLQMLLDQAGAAVMPAIRMRGGRVNFKFGQTKSVLFFDDTDFDITPYGNGNLALRFSGAPARTDISVQDFGHFFVRGNAGPSREGERLNLQVELEPSALDSLARLFGQSGLGLKGAVSLAAQVSGPVAHLDVKGSVRIEGDNARIEYAGLMDLTHQTVELASKGPLELHFNVANLLASPDWNFTAQFNGAPLAPALAMARRIGVPLPAGSDAQGALWGTIHTGATKSLTGDVELRDASLALPGGNVAQAATATLLLKGDTLVAGPVTVELAGAGAADAKESAEVQATYQHGDGGGLEVKVATRRMKIADLHAIGLKHPFFDRITGGVWRGAFTYSQPAGEPGGWSANIELQNASANLDGVAVPVRIVSALVSASPEQIAVTKMQGQAGAIAFTGDYRWDSESGKPARFRLQIPKADATELEGIFRPALVRQGGLLARTLRLGSAEAAPDWLVQRRIEGAIAIRSFNLYGIDASLTASRIVWEGLEVRLAGLEGKIAGETPFQGELVIDLRGRSPAYRLRGKVKGIEYKSGRLDFDGEVQAAGTGLALAASARASGTLQGRSILFSPEAEFKRVTGRFDMRISAAGPHWKFSDLELVQGAETYSGSGTTLADGKLILDLESNGRQVRYTGSLVALAPPRP
jgi:hypothetical protein